MNHTQKVTKNIFKNGEKGSAPDVVAKTIYRAATDNRTKLRYPTGNFKGLISLRKILPQSIFHSLVGGIMESGN